MVYFLFLSNSGLHISPLFLSMSIVQSIVFSQSGAHSLHIPHHCHLCLFPRLTQISHQSAHLPTIPQKWIVTSFAVVSRVAAPVLATTTFWAANLPRDIGEGISVVVAKVVPYPAVFERPVEFVLVYFAIGDTGDLDFMRGRGDVSKILCGVVGRCVMRKE